MSRICKSKEIESIFVVSRVKERAERGMIVSECKVSLWGDEKVLELDSESYSIL